MDDRASEWAAPVPTDRPDRLRAVAPVALLALIALLGVRNHFVRDQSSWQGASFGMFATYDNPLSRRVLVTVDRGEGPQRVTLPDDLQDDARRLRVAPTDGAAQALADAVLERVTGDGATVRVEVRHVDLVDRDDLHAWLELTVAAEASR